MMARRLAECGVRGVGNVWCKSIQCCVATRGMATEAVPTETASTVVPQLPKVAALNLNGSPTCFRQPNPLQLQKNECFPCLPLATLDVVSESRPLVARHTGRAILMAIVDLADTEFMRLCLPKSTANQLTTGGKMEVLERQPTQVLCTRSFSSVNVVCQNSELTTCERRRLWTS